MEYSTTIKVDDDEVTAYVAKNYDPEDIFDNDTLEAWASENGFIKETDIDYVAWTERNGYAKEE